MTFSFFFPSQIWVHQQVCISVRHDAPEGGRTPCRPGALQRWLPREAEELPQHWQPLTSLHQMLRRDLFSFNNTSTLVQSLFSRFSVNLAFRLVNRTFNVTQGWKICYEISCHTVSELISGSCSSEISVYSVYISMLQLCCTKIIIYAALTILTYLHKECLALLYESKMVTHDCSAPHTGYVKWADSKSLSSI